MAKDRSPKARAEAQRMLVESNVTRPDDIDLDVIAAANGAEIVDEDLEGATASVLRIGNVARIRISSRIYDIGWRRFSIAHELGHLRLGHEIPDGDAHDAIEKLCKPLDKARSVPEREASVFASEVVMPEHMVRPRCAVRNVTLGPARAIADEFTTSVLASAMRFVELTDESCAVAYSVLGRVKWIKPSATFPEWIPHGRRLDPRSAAFDYHDSGTLDDTAQLTTADVWLPRNKLDAANVQMVEHSAVIAPLGVVFSMLWIPRREIRHIDLAS
jgi:hypothetical protein